MRPLPLAAATVVLVAALAALAVGLHSFNRHRAVPWHIGLGSKYGHIVRGEPDYVSGEALHATRDTVLQLVAATFPYKHWKTLAAQHPASDGSFRFDIAPQVKTHYRVVSSIDKQMSSRAIAVLVSPTLAALRASGGR